MPRIPDEEIERLKRETDLAALVRSRGIELAPQGAHDLAGRCPFHDDKSPSFIVTPAKGLFHCMGCGVAGNAIQFVQKFDGLSFRHAYELLAEGKATANAPKEPLKTSTVKRLANPFADESGKSPVLADDTALMDRTIAYYHERLFKSPPAVRYLDSRGLYHEETLRRFRVGFADRSLGLRLPDKHRQEGLAIRTCLKNLGILRASGHERFTGYVVIPIPGLDGRPAKLYGRHIGTPSQGKGLKDEGGRMKEEGDNANQTLGTPHQAPSTKHPPSPLLARASRWNLEHGSLVE